LARLDALTWDLHAYASIASSQKRLAPVDLAAAVEGARAHVARALESSGGAIEVLPPLPRVLAHRPMLVEAIAHLLENGLKFHEPHRRPRVRVSAEARGDRVRLFIADDGIGIAPEDHERIFRVLERLPASERYPGHGIGLAIVKKALFAMGGAVGVDSRPGEGTRFWIELAAAPVPERASAA
ncbi:MAG TPA: ATP-binding protein, partial [Planctomycetota bacterium]|nr:ATP-binding protein [Planctomycetota bacterium]